MRHIGRISRLSQCAGANNAWGYLGGLQQSDLQQHTAGLVSISRQHATAAGGAGHNPHRTVLALIQVGSLTCSGGY